MQAFMPDAMAVNVSANSPPVTAANANSSKAGNFLKVLKSQSNNGKDTEVNTKLGVSADAKDSDLNAFSQVLTGNIWANVLIPLPTNVDADGNPESASAIITQVTTDANTAPGSVDQVVASADTILGSILQAEAEASNLPGSILPVEVDAITTPGSVCPADVDADLTAATSQAGVNVTTKGQELNAGIQLQPLNGVDVNNQTIINPVPTAVNNNPELDGNDTEQVLQSMVSQLESASEASCNLQPPEQLAATNQVGSASKLVNEKEASSLEELPPNSLSIKVEQLVVNQVIAQQTNPLAGGNPELAATIADNKETSSLVAPELTLLTKADVNTDASKVKGQSAGDKVPSPVVKGSTIPDNPADLTLLTGAETATDEAVANNPVKVEQPTATSLVETTVEDLVTEGASQEKSPTDIKTNTDGAMLFKLQQAMGNRLVKMEPEVTEPESIKHVLQRLELMVKENATQARLVLKPEHLGNLLVRMDVQDGVLTARFVVDSQQAKAMLETNLSVFRQQLEQNGVRVDKVEVTLNQTGNDASQFFNQSQYRQPGQSGYQNPNSYWQSGPNNYGMDDYINPTLETASVTAGLTAAAAAGGEGLNYVV